MNKKCYEQGSYGEYLVALIKRHNFSQSEFARRIKVKYTYGYKFNGQRMERQKILLPVNEKSCPDYEFMEQYGKQIMLQKYQQYLNYIDA